MKYVRRGDLINLPELGICKVLEKYSETDVYVCRQKDGKRFRIPKVEGEVLLIDSKDPQVIRIDARGRIQIPPRKLNAVGLQGGDFIMIYRKGNELVIRPKIITRGTIELSSRGKKRIEEALSDVAKKKIYPV